MFLQIAKSTMVLILILLVFIFLHLLPREIQITHHFGMVFTAEYPFNVSLYKERIVEFIQYFQTEKGFGVTRTGVPIVEEVKTLLGRSLLIVLPCFFLSLGLGTLIGTIQFYYREKFIGKTFSVISWLFSSIPDFFLYMPFSTC